MAADVEYMNARSDLESPDSTAAGAGGPVRCLVAYDNTAARDRALRLCDDVVRKFWGEIEFEFTWWRFDYLEDPVILRNATDAARRANVVILSARPMDELPPPVKAWIDTWSVSQAKPECALVALIGSPHPGQGGSGPLHAYLMQVAARASMDFLPDPTAAPPGRPETPFEELARRTHRKTPILESILRRPEPPSRWGINE